MSAKLSPKEDTMGVSGMDKYTTPTKSLTYRDFRPQTLFHSSQKMEEVLEHMVESTSPSQRVDLHLLRRSLQIHAQILIVTVVAPPTLAPMDGLLTWSTGQQPAISELRTTSALIVMELSLSLWHLLLLLLLPNQLLLLLNQSLLLLNQSLLLLNQSLLLLNQSLLPLKHRLPNHPLLPMFALHLKLGLPMGWELLAPFVSRVTIAKTLATKLGAQT
jgi:hypothetical protein